MNSTSHHLKNTRFEFLDYLKGIAVILMIIFHLAYDLSVFKFITINTKEDPFWYLQPKIIIAMFLVSVAGGLCLTHLDGIQWKKFIFRFGKILGLALIISAVTYLTFPNKWIYFGILHNIAFSSLIALPFLKFPKLSLTIGLSLIFPSVFYGYVYPFFTLKQHALDHVALLPWVGCVFIGIFLFHQGLHKIKIPKHAGKNFILLIGRYSLEIYIAHQAILFPLVYLASKILHSN